MNCIAGMEIRTGDGCEFSRIAGVALGIAAWLLCLLSFGFTSSCDIPASAAAAPEPPTKRIYGADYLVRPDISRGGAYVELRITQDRRLLRELSMPVDTGGITALAGDGEISVDDHRIRWAPPAEGGTLRWFAAINHLRNHDTYDAFVGADWAIFRAEDVIPPTATRTLARSASRTTLEFDLPDGWTAVTEYFRKSRVFNISESGRRFDKPTGWIVLGRLGVRHETIAGVRVVVAAPVDQAVQRLDILAMLNWTLPEIVRLLPGFPKRLTIVSAGEPMWRGALSAPGSFYVHADRPLISENGTSTITHESMHIGLGTTAVKGADWIIEGLAEYYSLEILRRSGTISQRRYRTGRSKLSAWGRTAKSICADPSTGPATARAVTLLAQLNDEIRKESGGKYDLDDVARTVAGSSDKVSIHRLRKIVADLTASESAILDDNKLDNCES